MLIKPLEEHNMYDIFLGEGWMNWLRVKMGPDTLEVVNKTDSVEVTKKLIDLVYFKIKRYRRQK